MLELVIKGLGWDNSAFSLATCTQVFVAREILFVLIYHIPQFLYNVLGKKLLGKKGSQHLYYLIKGRETATIPPGKQNLSGINYISQPSFLFQTTLF